MRCECANIDHLTDCNVLLQTANQMKYACTFYLCVIARVVPRRSKIMIAVDALIAKFRNIDQSVFLLMKLDVK